MKNPLAVAAMSVFVAATSTLAFAQAPAAPSQKSEKAARLAEQRSNAAQARELHKAKYQASKDVMAKRRDIYAQRKAGTLTSAQAREQLNALKKTGTP